MVREACASNAHVCYPLIGIVYVTRDLRNAIMWRVYVRSPLASPRRDGGWGYRAITG